MTNERMYPGGRLVAWHRYVELNPVRARMGRSEEFAWFDTEPCFEGLGDTSQEVYFSGLSRSGRKSTLR